MNPLNTAERKSSFFYFLMFFLITVGLIVLAVYFGMRVPFKENENMKEQIANLQQDEIFLYKFSVEMGGTQNLLDSINRPGVSQPDLIDGSITESLTKLNSMVNSDTASSHREICGNIIKNLSDLKDAKKQLRDAGASDATITALKDQIKDLEAKLHDANLLLAMQGQKSQ